MIQQEPQDILIQFQCDYNQMLEETFAQAFSENDLVRLFFINENRAFTDGKTIVVDPASDDLYFDHIALTSTEKYLGWKISVSSDSWYALRMITRAQTIHECLHILYSDFPCGAVTDLRCDTKNKKIAMSLISNIIEDAYIEAVGCSVYDNIEMYLKFGRVSRLFLTHPSQGTIAQKFKCKIEENQTESPLIPLYDFLNYMIEMLLYPMIIQDKPNDLIEEYIEKTKQLFFDGSVAPSPSERYEYSQKIFDIILPLIPDDNTPLSTPPFEQKLGGYKTHSVDSSTPTTENKKGKTQPVTVCLFTDTQGNFRESEDISEKLSKVLDEFEKQKQDALIIITYDGYNLFFTGQDYDCSVIHKNIQINENHPKIDFNLRKAYQNIYNRYRINISSYNRRFLQILKSKVSVREDKQLFGTGISSKMLGDTKKRYWYKNVTATDIPDLAVLILIDGSSSMSGERRNAAITSSVILHEVLKKQGILHSIVEHRASFDNPEIDVNILVDFYAKEDEKLNLMQIDAYGNTRDGLALFWAERYINQKVYCENKLIIIISDGFPEHNIDDYYPPVSTKDTANASIKIMKRGVNIIAVALDQTNLYDCYDSLKEIYKNIISCNNLNKLTGQLLTLISKQLN